MSPKANDDSETPHPRTTAVLFGHANAEAALLDAYRSGRIPHAFLIAGPKGIGKATLAYRLARFVLAHPDPAAPEVAKAMSLAVDPEHPVARRIAAQGQPDLLILERTLNDKGVLHKQIAVDDIRRTVAFFGSTARRGRLAHRHRRCRRRAQQVERQCAAQSAGRAAAARAVAAGEPFGGAGAGDVTLALPHPHPAAPGRDRRRGGCCGRDGFAGDRSRNRCRRAAADGSVSRALAFLDGDALELRQRALDLLDKLPTLDTGALHALGEAIAGTDPLPLAAFLDTINAWLSLRLDRDRGEIGRLARLADASERINAAARDAEIYNLERKPLVFGVFGLLAEATRG